MRDKALGIHGGNIHSRATRDFPRSLLFLPLSLPCFPLFLSHINVLYDHAVLKKSDFSRMTSSVVK
jgi:hypothetical protein